MTWFSISTRESEYTTWQARRAYFESIIEKLRATPGVEFATATITATPPYIGFETPFTTAGQAEPDPNQVTLTGLVGEDYFSTVHIPLLRGRNLLERRRGASRARGDHQQGNAGYLGGFGAWLLSDFLSRLVYGITATDPLTFAAVALLLATVALVACLIPAYRATRVEPLKALRSE